MAGFHPFRTFRKNQKFWLAILGVGTMISFIILPVLLQLFTGDSGQKIEEFGRSKRFGIVNEQTIYGLSQNRQQLEGFYRVLYQRLAGGGDETRMAGLNYLGSLISQYEQRESQEELVNSWLLAQYARSQGLAVNQNDVVAYLSQITSGYISDAVFKEVLKAVGMTEKRLEYLISMEMLAMQMRQSFEMSMEAITPATRWNWFQRMNRQVTAEVAAVPVDRFLDKVGQPTDAQLRQLFDKYKDKPYNPNSDESGFVIPEKVAFQYVMALPSKKMLDSVTDEEIKKYYDENKDSQFMKPIKPVGQQPGAQGLPGLPGQGGMFPGLGGFTPDATRRSTPFPSPNRAAGTPATIETPATETTEKAPEVKAEEPKKEEPKKEEPKKEEPKTEEKSEKTSSVLRSVQTRFVSYQTETEAKPAADLTGTSDTPKQEEVVDLSILYRPLEEVKDEIRETLARRKASEALLKIEEKMREYFQTYNLHIDLETEAEKIPPMPNLSDLAKELGLELRVMKLDTFFGAVRTEFARGLAERQRLAQMFMEAQLLFEPQNFVATNAPCLYWVTETVSELKPENVEDVRDLVVQRWKETEARAMALKQAEELAGKAKAAGKSFAETFSGNNEVPVVETEPFTWKTYGAGVSPWMAIMNRVPPRTGEVCEKGVSVGDSEIDNKWIFAPGNGFMEVAYSLGVGEIGVVFNQPKTVAYVVRITGSTPSDEVLWERFQTAHLMEYYLAGQPEVVTEGRDAWMQQIYKEIGFEWLKSPDAFYNR